MKSGALRSCRITGKDRLLHRPAVHLLLIAILGFLAYSNTFHSPFQWDEAVYLVDKPFIKDLTYFLEPSRLDRENVQSLSLRSRYVGYLTFALNYKLHGFEVFGYHVVNLAIHLINALLVYFFVFFTFRTPYFGKEQNAKSIKQSLESNKGLAALPYAPSPMPHAQFVALAVALLFVAHPIQTEAVTYVFQRLASLVTMFYLLSLVLYVKGRLTSEQASKPASWKTGKPAVYYFLALLSAVLAMKTKENAFTLPVIITLYEFLFFTGPLKSRILRLAPFLLTMLIIPMTLIGMSSPMGEIMSQAKNPASFGHEGSSGEEYLTTQFRVVVTYIRLLILPVNQNLYHDYPVYRSSFEPQVLLSIIFLSALCGFAVYLIYKSRQAGKPTSEQAVKGESVTFYDSLFTIHYSRLVAFGILWFFITLSVESSLIPVAMLIDEYRVYLPSVGFLLAIVTGAVLLVNRIAAHRARRIGQSEKDNGSGAGNSMLYALCILLIFTLVLASATYARNALWKDKISLWGDVVSKSPKFPLGYNNLGIAYYEKGLYEKAIGVYGRAIALFPVYLDSYLNMGVAYSALGRTDMAIETYTKALAMYPKNGTLYFNLAHAYAMSGRPAMAVENYLKVIQLDPFSSMVYQDLGTIYAKLGRFDDSIAAYTRFVELRPNDPEAYRGRGIVYEVKGDLSKARADFQAACSLGSKESCGYLEKSW